MVKLAQHIEWPSQLPSKAGEGVSSGRPHAHEKKVDRLLSNGKPRRTLAELFEARATSSASFSATVPPQSPPPAPSSTALPSSFSPPSSSASASLSSPVSLACPSSATLSQASARASSSSSSSSSSACKSSTSGSSLTSSSASTVQVHVTFDDKLCAIHPKPAAHKSSEFAGTIKRSSSARKIADSSAHEGMYPHPSAKRISKSGPLALSEASARNPLTNASNLEPSRWISPSKQSNGHINRKANEKPVRGSSNFQQEQRTPPTNSSNSESRYRSPFRPHEQNQKVFLLKSADSVGSVQNQRRQNESDPFVGKRPDAEYVGRVQGTPTKGKKSRRGLLALLTDVAGTKNPSNEVRISEDSEIATKAKPSAGGETWGFVSPPRNVSRDVGLGNEPMDGGMGNYQHLGSRLSGNLGKHEVGRESSSLTVEIPDKMLGLAWHGTEPRFLTSGTYCFPSEGFLLEQVVSERNSYVKHGVLHRVRIREGHLGVAWVDGKATLLEPGVSVHVCPSNKFSYITTDEKLILEKEFVLGPFRVVTVSDSEVGIKFCNRQPQILYSGRHCLSISKVEVFAGFESLLRRQSNVKEASAMSSDNMKVSADVWVEWQIKAEDAAAARLANITDVEGALCTKVRRAFNLVIWEVNGHDLDQLMRNAENTKTDPQPLLKTLSSNIHRECQELFEEGWTVLILDLQLKHLMILAEGKDAEG